MKLLNNIKEDEEPNNPYPHPSHQDRLLFAPKNGDLGISKALFWPRRNQLFLDVDYTFLQK